MLILSRRAGEAIRIGGNVRVVVMATGDGSVRLGIDAPGDVTILREELVLEVASENLRARAEPRSLADLVEGAGGPPAAHDSPPSPSGPDPESGSADADSRLPGSGSPAPESPSPDDQSRGN